MFKLDEKKIRIQVINAHLINEILDLVIDGYSEIVAKAMIRVVDKHPELFKIECPICQSELHTTDNNPDYWMCNKCVKGFNTEELKEMRKNE